MDDDSRSRTKAILCLDKPRGMVSMALQHDCHDLFLPTVDGF